MQPVYLLKSLDVNRAGCVTQSLLDEMGVRTLRRYCSFGSFFPSQVYPQCLMKPFVKQHINYI